MKRCEACGRSYYRRNLTELWVRQNPGHRAGWVKRLVRICTTCQNAQQASRILKMVRVTVTVRQIHKSA